MAKAFKCDICENLFEAPYTLKLRVKDHRCAYLKCGSLCYDICPDCTDAIQEVINTRMNTKGGAE